VSLLLALPALPLALAAMFALLPGIGPIVGARIVALAASLPVAVAVLAPDQRLDLPTLLVQHSSALVLDTTSRAALLLFGGLWLVAGWQRAFEGERKGPAGPALLVALAGAVTLAIADGGPLVYAGLLATGYGLYAIMAGEPDDDWRRAGRALVVLLVLSDLLVFEVLLSATAEAAGAARPGLLALGLLALVLRGVIPPAHAWLPPALVAVSAPTAVLLIAVPAGSVLFGALKILPQGAAGFGSVCATLALAGCAFVTVAGLAQAEARATLGYVAAATATLLLLALPAGAGSGGQLGWLGLAMLAACAVLPLSAIGRSGWPRDVASVLALSLYGLAAGQAAVHASAAIPRWAAWLAPLAVVAATLLLTVAAQRAARDGKSIARHAAPGLAFLPLLAGGVGLLAAWRATPPDFLAAWMAPVGITLGLAAMRVMPGPATIPAGDLLGRVERSAANLLALAARACRTVLPRTRDRLAARLTGLWDGEAWSQRMQVVDLRLRNWPATSLMLLLVALGAAFLLAR
jgi:hypothetical protein